MDSTKKNKVISIAELKQSVAKEQEKNSSIENIIRVNAEIEFQKYEQMVANMIEEMKNMAAYKPIIENVVEEQIRFFFINEIQESLVKPIFEDKKPAFIKQEDFDAMRQEMFESLRNKYIEE